MAASKSKKSPKVGNYRGGTKRAVGGRGGFLGKTTSGGNLGRAAMANTAAISAAKGYGKGGGEAAAAFGAGGGASGVAGGSSGGGTAYGGATGLGNASGAGLDYSPSGIIESISNPGGGYIPTPAGGWVSGVPGPGGGTPYELPGDVGPGGQVTYQPPATPYSIEENRPTGWEPGGSSGPANAGREPAGGYQPPTSDSYDSMTSIYDQVLKDLNP
jgi:hypothetical protein